MSEIQKILVPPTAGLALSAGIRLVSGNLFNYGDPRENNVLIEDLATSLGNCCRFAGHLPYHYSVAQHSLNASYIVTPEFAFTALMHDTAEAFTGDIPTPLKYAIPLLKELEVVIEEAMSEKFGFQFPLPLEVKWADTQMLGLEKIYVKEDHSWWAILDGIEFDHLLPLVDLSPMQPEMAAGLFLKRYYELAPLVHSQLFGKERAD